MAVIFVFFLAAIFAIIFKHKIEVVIAPTIISVILVSYYLTVMNLILLARVIFVIFSIASVVAVVYCCIRFSVSVGEYVITPGGIAYFLYVIFFWIFSNNVDLSHGSDPQCWVNTVKRLCLSNDYVGTMTQVAMYDPHPHFYKIWEYLVETTCMRWSYQAYIFGKNMLMVVGMMIFFSIASEYHKNKKRNIVAIFFIILLIPYISISNEYANVGADVLLGIYLGVGVVYFILALKKGIYSYHLFAILFFVASSGIKRSAIILVFFELMVILIVLFKEKQYKIAGSYIVLFSLLFLLMRSDNVSYIILIFPSVIASFIIANIINRITKLRGIVIAIVSFILTIACLSLLFYLIKGDRGSEIIRAFCNVIFTNDSYSIGMAIPLSLPIFLAIGIVIFVFSYRYGEIKDSNIAIIFFGEIIVEFLYILLLLYLYLTEIGPVNIDIIGPVAGLERYLSTGTIIFFIVFIMCLIINKGQAVVLPILVISLFLSNTRALVKYILIQDDCVIFSDFVDKGIDLTSEDMIAYVDMGHPNWNQQFKLDVIPAEVNVITNLEYRSDSDNYEYMDITQLDYEFRTCKYIYIRDITDDFKRIYKDLFENSDEIKGDGSIYYYSEKGKLKLFETNY